MITAFFIAIFLAWRRARKQPPPDSERFFNNKTPPVHGGALP